MSGTDGPRRVESKECVDSTHVSDLLFRLL